MITASEAQSWSDMIGKLQSFVGRRIRNAPDRDDMVQDILLRVLDHLPDLRTPEKLGPWIYRIAGNAIVDYWRRNPARFSALPEDYWAAPETGDEDTVLRCVAEHLHLLVRNLPQPYREALTLTEMDGLTHRHAAARTGVSLPAMKSRVRRGRLLLKDALEACCRLEVTPTGHLVGCEPRSAEGLPACRAC